MSERAKLLHDSPWRGVLHLAGGAGILGEMLATAGASRTVLEAKVPYAAASLAELLGGQPEQACSGTTARALAMAAFQRALKLAGQSAQSNPADADELPSGATAAPPAGAQCLFGLGVTASLATDRTKRGPCRVHIAVQTLASTCYASFSLSGDRPAQEAALVEHGWRTLLQSLEVGPPPDPTEAGKRRAGRTAPQTANPKTPRDAAGDQRSAPSAPPIAESEAAQAWQLERVRGLAPWCALFAGSSRTAPIAHDGKLLFPGAFNPLHEGHGRMMAIAEAKTGLVGAFELSVENIDKPLLDYAEIQRRLQQFKGPVWLTRLPTFTAKAQRFPGATFIVGIDTLVRIADPRYYGGVPALRQALAALVQQKARFLVFGRVLDGVFQGLDQAELPDALAQLCSGVDEVEFRADISSTDLRQQRR